MNRIEELTALLTEFRQMGHRTDESEVRVLSGVRYPFLIFCTIDDMTDEIVILHVRHTAQDRPEEAWMGGSHILRLAR